LHGICIESLAGILAADDNRASEVA